MATYTKSTNSYGGRYYKITLTQKGHNSETGIVNVHREFEVLGGSSSYYSAPKTVITATSSVDGSVTEIYSHKKTMYPDSTSFPVAKGSSEKDYSFQTDAQGNLTLSIKFTKDEMTYNGSPWTAFSKTEDFVLDQIPRIVAPTVSAITASSITSSSASLAFTVTDDGGETPTTGIQVSTTNFGTVVKSISSNSGSVTGLSRVTTYYARGFATNSAGTTYTAVKSFTTLAVKPTLSAVTVSSITATGASASFSVSDNGGASVTSQGVQFSTTNFGTAVKSFSGTSGSVTGLTRYTTYYVRAYATNSIGTSYSAVKSFTTLAQTPVLSAITTSNITYNSVTASYSVTDNGGRSITSNYIDIFTDSACTEANKVSYIASTSGTFTGLTPNTTYYLRANSNNGSYKGYSAVKSITTAKPAAPSISSITTPTISSNSVKVTVNATAGAGASSLQYRFSKDGGSTYTSWQSSNTYTFSSLSEDTSYTFRAQVKDNYSTSTTSSTISATTLWEGTVSVINNSISKKCKMYIITTSGVKKVYSKDIKIIS